MCGRRGSVDGKPLNGCLGRGEATARRVDTDVGAAVTVGARQVCAWWEIDRAVVRWKPRGAACWEATRWHMEEAVDGGPSAIVKGCSCPRQLLRPCDMYNDARDCSTTVPGVGSRCRSWCRYWSRGGKVLLEGAAGP
jgi:hypothetical protein